jgi:hypothetical protein
MRHCVSRPGAFVSSSVTRLVRSRFRALLPLEPCLQRYRRGMGGSRPSGIRQFISEQKHSILFGPRTVATITDSVLHDRRRQAWQYPLKQSSDTERGRAHCTRAERLPHFPMANTSTTLPRRRDEPTRPPSRIRCWLRSLKRITRSNARSPGTR